MDNPELTPPQKDEPPKVPPQTGFLPKGTAAGELGVWLTGMMLVAGVAMIVLLLAFIVWNGLAFFWPARVAELKLEDDSQLFRNQNFLAGEIVEKRVKPLTTADSNKSQRELTEIRIFMGNKEVYGESFLWLDSDSIERREYPAELMFAERAEKAPAIFYPVSLTLENGEVVKAGTGEFTEELQSIIREGEDRRGQIEKLRRNELARIEARLSSAMEKKDLLSSQPGDLDIAGLAELQKEIDAALEEREQLRKELAELIREQREIATLNARLASGEELSFPATDINYCYYPNQLDVFDKLNVALHRARVFVFEDPRESGLAGGIFPAIFGTFIMTIIMSAAVMPFGVVAAIYLREYAKQGLLVKSVRICVNNLAGVPSIVFGIFGLAFFVYFVGGGIDSFFFSEKHAQGNPTFGTGGVLWASLTLALLTLPVVIVATEEALSAVPLGTREAALACGASKWQVIRRVVLPGAAPGILTGLILAMARGAGEVAPLMLTGVVKSANKLAVDGEWPFLHLERKFMHMGFHIFDLGFQSPDSEAAKPIVFATTFLLILLVVVLNLGAIYIRSRLRRKYSIGTF